MEDIEELVKVLREIPEREEDKLKREARRGDKLRYRTRFRYKANRKR